MLVKFSCYSIFLLASKCLLNFPVTTGSDIFDVLLKDAKEFSVSY